MDLSHYDVFEAVMLVVKRYRLPQLESATLE